MACVRLGQLILRRAAQDIYSDMRHIAVADTLFAVRMCAIYEQRPWELEPAE